MSIYATNSSTTDPVTGLPVPTGLVYVTTGGQYYSTNPIGEPPGGVNSTPGTDPNVPGASTPGNNPNPAGNAQPGVPYNFTPPVNIGPTS
jgi:hypothetical protein